MRMGHRHLRRERETVRRRDSVPRWAKNRAGSNHWYRKTINTRRQGRWGQWAHLKTRSRMKSTTTTSKNMKVPSTRRVCRLAEAKQRSHRYHDPLPGHEGAIAHGYRHRKRPNRAGRRFKRSNATNVNCAGSEQVLDVRARGDVANRGRRPAEAYLWA